MTFKRLLIMLIPTVLVFGAVFGMKWFGNKMMVQFLANMPVTPATVSVADVQVVRWAHHLDATGTFNAVQGADLSTEVGGIVTALHFESGDHVRAGQLLVSLDAVAEQGELERLKAQAQLSELNRSRRARLYQLKSISRADYDLAEAQAAASKAAVAAQQGRLAQKQIRAPFSGVLGIRQVSLGQYVAAGVPMVTLQAQDPINLDFMLPEQYGGQIHAGFAVQVRVDAAPDRVFDGKVLAVEPRVDAGTHNFVVRARVGNAEGALRPGQFGRVQLQMPGEREVMIVPRTAIRYTSTGAEVFLAQDLPAEKIKALEEAPKMPGAPEAAIARQLAISKPVTLGDSRGDFVVVEGLHADDRVITSGLLKLRNEYPILINNELAPAVKLDPQTPKT